MFRIVVSIFIPNFNHIAGNMKKEVTVDFPVLVDSYNRLAGNDEVILVLEDWAATIHIFSWAGQKLGCFSPADLDLEPDRHAIDAIWTGNQRALHLLVYDSSTKMKQVLSKMVCCIMMNLYL